ncbi:MAG: RES family NAD+ phosphorylase (plasmid) [Candidatus Manganitrophus sp.]|nr:RES family NAD+ phosphorylase [Candidatus Manganitrophus sp.]MDC4228136.1 RES family NAD+ phosphorylase [Candidatus Manganitrophus sp.]WDT73615.1 MAG: RES family NAD+ phosphorylase [Candidatus Manganitrophus sp.]WDT82912.1 MAG: RES family NAD+ phosphorylase [Candidatus Manganitrophus sp.]
MREVYRIALAKHARDLSGKGARLTGGRWNTKDTAVIYTSESRSLAAMEYLVHVSLTDIPPEIKITSIGIPETIIPKEIDSSDLPKDWRKSPAPFLLGDIGAKWVSGMDSLLLRVPSAVVLHEFNILINPAHPDMKSVKIVDVESFIYDERLHKPTK